MSSLHPHLTHPSTYLHLFTVFIPAGDSTPWRDAAVAEMLRATEAQNAAKYGETAGITCLTLQPVLALVSMNMTFSSLALCSPSSIMICLQEEKKKKKTGGQTSASRRRRLIYSSPTGRCFRVKKTLTAAERKRAHLFSSRSVLLPTSMMMTSLPLSVLTSSIHLQVCWNEFTSVEGRLSFYHSIQSFVMSKQHSWQVFRSLVMS